MKKQISPEERRFLITYITLDVSYSDEKKVRIRKIHKDIESDKLKKSKINSEDQIYIYDNQIDLDMFFTFLTEPFDIFNARHMNLIKKINSEEFKTELKDLSKYGSDFYRTEEYFSKQEVNPFKHSIDIYVSMKFPDNQLIDNLCQILHELCKKYLKTSIMITGKDSIICRIDNCSYSGSALAGFLEDFVRSIEKSVLKEN